MVFFIPAESLCAVRQFCSLHHFLGHYSAAHEVPPPVATRALPSLEWLDAVGIEIDERARTLTIRVSVLDEEPVLPGTELVLAFREEDGGDLLLELPQPSRKLRITPLGGGQYLL